MSRLHEALRRATEGKTQILPPEAGVDGGQEATPNQPAFTVPWALDAAPGEGPATGPGGEPVRTGPVFRLQSVPGSRHLSNEKLVVSIPSPGTSGLSVAVEQYRKLAASLHHAQVDRGLRLLMVTSTNPGEGKSLTTSNLALTLSESYERRVLLVDGDLRKPSLHDTFGVPNVSGLIDGLQRDPKLGLAGFEFSPRLALLPSGGSMADPTSLLTSAAMRRVLEEARARYDWTIVDTPPVGLLSDASHLSDMVDGVLLVVQAGESQYQDILKAVDTIGRERLIGVVLNRVPYSFNASQYYSQYYGRRPAAAS
jgi:capsular exopolysaccharide synthesis family protein